MKVVLLLPLVLLIAACGNSISQGKVIAKGHEDASTSMMMMPIMTGQVCSGSGTTYSPRVCTPIYTYIPYTVYDDEDWKLELVNGKHHGWLYVSQSVYDTVTVGEFYTKGDGDSTKDPPKKLHKGKPTGDENVVH
jgi:hypothetical protein